MSENLLQRLERVLRCMDLTSLSDHDTPDDISALCGRAARPGPGPSLPAVAAVCVYPRFVALACERLAGSGVRIAAAAGAFPTGEALLGDRVGEIRRALEAGATEIDTVLDHRAFLAGRRDEVAEVLTASRTVCGDATMKVILETGALGSGALVREAAQLAMDAGADFIKSSTGKIAIGATPGAARSMMEAVADFHGRTGRRVGVKLSSGIRTAEQALEYLEMLGRVLGPEWATPALFRIGASSLLDDVVWRFHTIAKPLEG